VIAESLCVLRHRALKIQEKCACHGGRRDEQGNGQATGMTARERLYFDYNATAPLLTAARSAMVDAMDLPGNPSSVHAEGRKARAVIGQAREAVARLCDVPAAQVVFCSGATEAANHVLTPDFRMGRSAVRVSRLLVSAVEHPAMLAGGRFSADEVTVLPVDRDGRLDLEALASALAAHDQASGQAMLGLQLANNETGVIQPVRQAADIVRAHHGLMVVDAVQGAGRIPLSLEALGADFLILSGHKIGGPKGIGALVSAGEILMPAPLLRGGGQEKGHRGGTECQRFKRPSNRSARSTSTSTNMALRPTSRSDMAPKGLNEEVVRFISAKKEEPEWMLEQRLDAYQALADHGRAEWARSAIRRSTSRTSIIMRRPRARPARRASTKSIRNCCDLREARHSAERAGNPGRRAQAGRAEPA
jgi:selenocysteine lyase/cysteine desulfurase